MPALLQISEPTSAAGTASPIGIDLGTTHSLVGAVLDGKARVLEDVDGSVLLPSVVRYQKGVPPQVGLQIDKLSKDGANGANGVAAGSVLSSVKRFMGRNLEQLRKENLPNVVWEQQDGTDIPRIKTVSGAVSAVEASAEILKTLLARATRVLGTAPRAAVITVPAYFDHAQRSATTSAARLAGIHVLRLLNEPTAAAISYGLDRAQRGVVAVYDLGGGTFDISILRLEKGVFSVLATSGDTALGGDDFDMALARYILDKSAGTREGKNLSAEQWQQLLQFARRTREDLSEHKRVELSWGDWRGTLDAPSFNKLVADLVERTGSICRQCVADAGLEFEDIDEVVLAGGATRTPAVREAVTKLFGKTPCSNINPDQVVVLGAAMQAHMLSEPSEDALLLLDVVALSLGIEVLGGLVEPVIRRNTPIPASVSREFTTAREGQTALAIAVYQGERDLVKDCRLLGHFELRGIPPMAAGAARIQVEFTVDADGLLNVSAQETVTGVKNGVSLKLGSGLTEEDIASTLEDAFANAEQDKQARTLNEQRTHARVLVDTLNAALVEDGKQLLSTTEQKNIKSAIDKTERVLGAEKAELIREAVESLDESSAFYVERRMDAAIKKALLGKSIRE